MKFSPTCQSNLKMMDFSSEAVPCLPSFVIRTQKLQLQPQQTTTHVFSTDLPFRIRRCCSLGDDSPHPFSDSFCERGPRSLRSQCLSVSELILVWMSSSVYSNFADLLFFGVHILSRCCCCTIRQSTLILTPISVFWKHISILWS